MSDDTVVPGDARHRQWLDKEMRRLLEFGHDAVAPAGGAAPRAERDTPANISSMATKK